MIVDPQTPLNVTAGIYRTYPLYVNSGGFIYIRIGDILRYVDCDTGDFSRGAEFEWRPRYELTMTLIRPGGYVIKEHP